jgi:uncharacterized protein (DUF433 family)
MSVATKRIRHDPGVLGGAARIRDMRIAVWMLVESKLAGATGASILADYPELEEADLTAAWAYYAAHRSEVDAHLRRNADARGLDPSV